MNLSAVQLPPPANWQDFERLCRDLFAAEWGDKDAVAYGRSGQAQHGIDIFGLEGGAVVGVQCKLKTETDLSKSEVENELAKISKRAEAKPDSLHAKLGKVVFATTARRSTAHADLADEFSTDELKVVIYAWDDLVERLAQHENVIEACYDWLGFGARSPTTCVATSAAASSSVPRTATTALASACCSPPRAGLDPCPLALRSAGSRGGAVDADSDVIVDCLLLGVTGISGVVATTHKQ